MRGMSRREASDAALRDLGAEPVRCDLETVTAEHLNNSDVVLHCAACVEAWGPKDAWHRVNVLGTQALLEAARGADAYLCAHVGFEAAAHMHDLLNGRLVGQRIRVQLWRVPAWLVVLGAGVGALLAGLL